MYNTLTNQEIATALEKMAPCLADSGICDEAAHRIRQLEKQNDKLRNKLRLSRRKFEELEERCAVLERNRT